MTKRTAIAVACNLDPAGSGVPITGLLETYPEALVAGGGMPFIIPASTDEDLLNDYLDMACGLFLPGGIDVDPLLFGQGPNVNIGRVDPLLDLYQIFLTRLARKRKMPILGVCRGIQLINVAFGGTLIQHIPDMPSTFSHRQTMNGRWPSHTVRAEDGSLIAEIYGSEFLVNSFHHQAVDSIAPGFRATARSSDGIVEAIESMERDSEWIIGVQWHPERMIQDLLFDLELFKRFTAAASEYLKIR